MKKLASLSCLLVLSLFLIAGCGGRKTADGDGEQLNETEVLLNWLEVNGNVINSPAVPAIVDPEFVFENLDTRK